MDLIVIRAEIDAVDQELVALLEKRMELVSQVAAFKKATGKAVLDSNREEAVLQQVAHRLKNKDYEDTIVATYRDIMAHSRAYQAGKLEGHPHD